MKVTPHLIFIAASVFPPLSMAQEILVTPQTSNTPKVWTFNAGIGSPKAWNYAGITREYLIDKHTSVFVTGGLGTALIGTGIAYYGNREGNGIVVSSTIGIVDLQATLAYQVKIGPEDFVSAGESYGMFFMQCYCLLPVLSYEHRY